MEQIPTPKKERKFLKAIGRVAGVLVQELALGLGRKYIGKMINKIKIAKKRETLSFLLLLSCTFAFAQYPNTGNKQRLGFQTTADGLVWRGSLSDTASIQPVSNQNAWVILDTVNLKIYSFDFTSNVWNQVGTGGGSAFTQPIDSLFFKTSVSPNNVDTAKMRWDSELGTVVLGMYDQVPNELGFKNFWLVKNQTGSTIAKNSLVYASGTVGASGRITIAKFIANGTIDAKYLLGITAHDLSNGEDGYVISFGKIRQVNTDTFADGAILYPSPTTAGVWTDVEPVAPNLDMPIGFCINSHVNNGTIAIRVASGYSLNELHNVAISSPVEKSSLYYTGGLWRDTTAALLVSDTATMLTNYLRTGVAASTYTPLTRSISTTAPLQGGGDLSANRTFSITQASGSVNGFLSSTDWTTFNGKGNGTVTSVTASGPMISSGGTTPNLSMPAADVNISGYVTHTGTQIFTGNKSFLGQTTMTGIAFFKDYTYQATRLAGLSSTDRFATVTLGTGLTLSSGTLSATGGVTSVTASTPLSSSGGATPNITIADAGASASGVVNTTTQSFAGNKTFSGTVTLSSVSGTATSVIGRSSTGQVVGVSLGSGLNLSSGTLNLGGFVLATLDFPNTSAQSSSDITVSYTGAAVSHPVMLAIPDGSAPANTNYTAWVSSANTVKIRFNNYSSGSINPASGQFTVFVLNL
jgi:hypothetical protein